MPALTSPASTPSSSPTADALADAVVNAELPAEPSARRPGTLPRPVTTRLPAVPPTSRVTGPMAVVSPPAADEAAQVAYAPTADPSPAAPAASSSTRSVGDTLVPAPRSIRHASAPIVTTDLDEDAQRRAARPTERVVVPSPEARISRAVPVLPVEPRAAGSTSPDDGDEPEIELTTSADDAVIDEQPAPPPAPVTAVAGSDWLGRLSARIDAMLDADEDDGGAGDGDRPPRADTDPFEGDTVRRAGPPPRSRPIPKITQPVDPDDIEASLELSPTVPAPGNGVFVGPPPRTRRSAVLAVPPAPVLEGEGEGDADAVADDADRPAVVDRSSSGSMLPPRVRRGPDQS